MIHDAREQGRIILAHGEVTGHGHEVLVAGTETVPDLTQAQYFTEPDGTRLLTTLVPCVLKHEEHGQITIDPRAAAEGAALIGLRALKPGQPIPGQYVQGDVQLHPVGAGTWRVVRAAGVGRTGGVARGEHE